MKITRSILRNFEYCRFESKPFQEMSNLTHFIQNAALSVITYDTPSHKISDTVVRNFFIQVLTVSQ